MGQTLANKVALVTGGSRGIGRAVAQTLMREGATVYLTYNRQVNLAREVVPANQALMLDLANQSSIEWLTSDLPRIDILVNNAGINHPSGFLDIGPDLLQKILQVNVIGPFELTRQLYPKINSGGSIIWLGSSSAATGGPRSVHYAAAKAALEGINRGVAIFGAKREIRSNLVAPGYLQSNMADAALDDPAVQKTISRIPLKRMGMFQDVAELVAFLVSDAAGYVTGQIIRVDGGLIL